MVRFIFLFAVSFLFQNCCYYGLRNSHGFPRNNNFNLNLVNSKIDYSQIDTTCVYENIGYYENSILVIDDNRLGKNFIKFYENGRIAEFLGVGYDKKLFKLTSNYSLNKEEFNPLNSYMGYYYFINNRLEAKQFLNNQCDMFWVKSTIYIKNDTLIQEYNRFFNNSIYVKREIPVEYLIYKPDW